VKGIAGEEAREDDLVAVSHAEQGIQGSGLITGEMPMSMEASLSGADSARSFARSLTR